MSYDTITVKQLFEKVDAGDSVNVIDVRTPAEFHECHVTVARNMPLDRLEPSQLESREPIYVICRSGSRSKMACEKLVQVGHAQIINVEGGTMAWEKAGYPVKRGKKAMSLERQVRIVAGSFVLLGVGLSFVSPWFLILSGFIGAGLVFSGITDTCGMGMVLSKMPWNQVRGSACEAASGSTQPTA